MKSTTFAIAALAGVAAAAPSYGNATSVAPAYITEVVTSLETYCPSATVLTYNSKTYTVTEPTTLTVTDCPCLHTVPATQVAPSSTVTAVVSSFVTVCPSPTVFTTKSKTYTVTSATTLTITHCPGGCTVTGPASYVCPTSKPASKPAPSMASMVPASMASKPPVTVTKMVSSYTTYCPSATTFTVKGSTYSVSTPTTLTITHCPGGCPVATTVPAPKAPMPAGSMPAGSMPAGSAPPAVTTPMMAPSASVGGGVPVSQISDGQIQAPTGTAPAQYTGAADKAMAGGSLFAAGLAAALMI